MSAPITTETALREIRRSLDPTFAAEHYDEERAERYARREGLE